MLALAFLTVIGSTPALHADTDALRAQLLTLRAKDQAAMHAGPDENALRANVAELRSIIAAEGGWPALSRVGKDGAQAAWLVAQHADFDPAFQREALALLQALATQGEANADDVAYLEDRVAIGAGKPQRYATQGECRAGAWFVFHVDEPAGVDARRAQVGLEPLVDYTARATRSMCGASR